MSTTDQGDDARAALGSAVDRETWQRSASAPHLSEQRAHVAALARTAREQPIPELPDDLYGDYERTGDRGAFESRYFARRRGLAALAITALLEPDGDTDTLADLITAICDEPYWAVPAHVARDGLEPRQVIDLFAAETASALAEITALLADRLPGDVVTRARAEVIGRVIEPYERHTYWWEDFPNNWAAVCAGSVALAAMQVCEPERVRALLPRLRASLRRSLDGYGDDGVCVEGFGYWRYGFGYYLVATEALDAVFGPETEPGRAAEAARWPLRAFLSGRTVVSFADTWLAGTADAGLLAGADRRYGDVGVPAPELTDAEIIDDCGRWALALRSLCWAVAGEVAAAAAGADRPRWYADAQWLVVPESAHSPIGFAARAGHNGEPHNHNDLGSVIVARAGQMLIADAGRGVYDREYFGPNRYDNPAAGSHGHSVPMLDGVVQSEGASARAEVHHVALGDGWEVLEIDLTSAYPHPALTRLVRVVERRGSEVRVTDRMEASAPVSLTERFITVVPPEVVDGTVLILADGARAELRLDPEASVATGSFPVGRGSFPIPAHYVDVTLPGATAIESAVVIAIS
ncbi:heparinase II/III domain-containing protein [Pseudactinotalea terrae]|uniref:heparinase II/III domain-containing protein n=1 Tax=Pseudactinotalea terrae TaxID=1743262 RepID=UPI0012E13019|nr:heparinase II/III family protein [Pseudactinotalea terrae]